MSKLFDEVIKVAKELDESDVTLQRIRQDIESAQKEKKVLDRELVELQQRKDSASEAKATPLVREAEKLLKQAEQKLADAELRESQTRSISEKAQENNLKEQALKKQEREISRLRGEARAEQEVWIQRNQQLETLAQDLSQRELRVKGEVVASKIVQKAEQVARKVTKTVVKKRDRPKKR